ncbi:teashirt homolog 1-A-like [Branchiostoma floridae]|uniref:Teashirt homolog 1-A-like n=1 Tax=Branchiostoma floridae TaxID=7739 RepID=A0A9J7MS70_BRAFL|nr:teashirt homolog 1-A-like [Branchiostoma floridae]
MPRRKQHSPKKVRLDDGTAAAGAATSASPLEEDVDDDVFREDLDGDFHADADDEYEEDLENEETFLGDEKQTLLGHGVYPGWRAGAIPPADYLPNGSLQVAFDESPLKSLSQLSEGVPGEMRGTPQTQGSFVDDTKNYLFSPYSIFIRSNLRRQNRSYNGGMAGKLKCKYCGEAFESLFTLTVHMSQTGHFRSQSTCVQRLTQKSTKPKKRSMLDMEEKEHTDAVLKCMGCGQSFDTLQDLTVHMMQTKHYEKIAQKWDFGKEDEAEEAPQDLTDYFGNNNLVSPNAEASEVQCAMPVFCRPTTLNIPSQTSTDTTEAAKEPAQSSSSSAATVGTLLPFKLEELFPQMYKEEDVEHTTTMTVHSLRASLQYQKQKKQILRCLACSKVCDSLHMLTQHMLDTGHFSKVPNGPEKTEEESKAERVPLLVQAPSSTMSKSQDDSMDNEVSPSQTNGNTETSTSVIQAPSKPRIEEKYLHTAEIQQPSKGNILQLLQNTVHCSLQKAAGQESSSSVGSYSVPATSVLESRWIQRRSPVIASAPPRIKVEEKEEEGAVDLRVHSSPSPTVTTSAIPSTSSVLSTLSTTSGTEKYVKPNASKAKQEDPLDAMRRIAQSCEPSTRCEDAFKMHNHSSSGPDVKPLPGRSQLLSSTNSAVMTASNRVSGRLTSTSRTFCEAPSKEEQRLGSGNRRIAPRAGNCHVETVKVSRRGRHSSWNPVHQMILQAYIVSNMDTAEGRPRSPPPDISHDDKVGIAHATGLTMTAINHWVANVRYRLRHAGSAKFVKNYQTTSPLFQCLECGTQPTTPRHFVSHLENHLGFKVTDVNAMAAKMASEPVTRQAVNSSKVADVNENSFKCSLCSCEFKSRHAVKIHLSKTHEKSPHYQDNFIVPLNSNVQ